MLIKYPKKNKPSCASNHTVFTSLCLGSTVSQWIALLRHSKKVSQEEVFHGEVCNVSHTVI